MTTRYDATLAGTPLSMLGDAVYVLDIRESSPSYRTISTDAFRRMGSRLIAQYRQGLTVTIRFAIRVRDPHTRQLLASGICAWAAQEGYLTLSTRPDQRLYVRCTRLPYIDSALRWTGELTAEFTAYEVPFWENTVETSLSFAAAINTMAYQDLYVPGTTETPLNASLDIINGATAFRIGRSDTAYHGLTFSGMTLGAGSTVEITHDAQGLLSVSSGGGSLMPYLQASSDDDVFFKPGVNTLYFYADDTVRVNARIRGRWL